MAIQFKITNNQHDWEKIREEVFVVEQGFENEFDHSDSSAMHLTLYDDHVLIGTCRGLIKDGIGQIGRLAVLKEHRQKGYGKLLVEKMEELLKSYGVVEFELSAQVYAIPFYKGLGYEAVGQQEYEEHVLHQKMIKSIEVESE